MDKQTLVRDMKKEFGSFPTISELARYMGKSRDNIRILVDGLDYLPDGRAKKYFVSDVADRILQQKSM